MFPGIQQQLIDRGIHNTATLRAMQKVPREAFVPKEITKEAYQDNPLPIGYGQTISQPYIVGYMTALSQPSKQKKVLEIGTGSGYQAAVLGEVFKEVYSIEIIPELANQANKTLQELKYSNVHVRCSDGYFGWPEKGPFDAILVTAAAEKVPPPLLEQLAEKGRLIIPVGSQGWFQELMVYEKIKGQIHARRTIGVRFVPFTRHD